MVMVKAIGALYGIRLMVDELSRNDPDREKKREAQNKEFKNGIPILDDKIILREPTKEESKRFNELIFFRQELGVQLVIESNYEDLRNCHDGIYNTVFALRLNKNNRFFLRFIEYEHKSNKYYEIVEYYPINKIYYKLHYNELEKIKKYVNKISKIKYERHKNYSKAAKRYYNSHVKLELEDKIIDLCIAFESLFLKGEDLRPKGKVIGLSCSMLLGKNNRERRSIEENIERIFKCRNNIIHGKEYNKKELEKIIPQANEYVKGSLLKLMPINE